jgi:hypothetical protein
MSKVKFKIDGVPYEVPDYLSIENYVKIYKIKDLFEDQYFAAKLVNIVTGAPTEDLLDGGYQEIQYIASYILSNFPTQDDVKFKDKFELDGVKYGFFPNWRDLTFAEFVDMDTLLSKKPEEVLDLLHIICAIMYRPIIEQTSEHNFKIEEYEVESMKKRAELFKKKLDVSYILGAQFFFIKFARRFLNFTPSSSITKIGMWTQLKLIWMMWRMIFRVTSKKPMGGFLSSTKLLTTILLNTNTSTKRN